MSYHRGGMGDMFNNIPAAATPTATPVVTPATAPATAPADTGMSTMTMLAIGAAGVGAYLLYRHYKKKGGEKVSVSEDSDIAPLGDLDLDGGA